MRRPLLAAAIALVIATQLHAALPVGTRAPAINTRAALAGEEFHFSLEDALKKGPVVLYFFVSAFTPGCTTEAHEFAEATDKFQELGATVIGVSRDDIDTLKRFSASEGRNRFAMASDTDGRIVKAYDAVQESHPGYASRISYVIAPTGEIIYSYTAMNPVGHVSNTMAALRKWKLEHSSN
jgi:peroxiredoxin